MLILDGASENKLTELVKVSEELNETLREYYPGVHKIIPDRAALIWCAIDGEIAKRQDQIDKILNTKKRAEQIVLRRACSELKKRIRTVQPVNGRTLWRRTSTSHYSGTADWIREESNTGDERVEPNTAEYQRGNERTCLE